MNAEIKISKELLERVLVYLEHHEDDGDYRESWKSDQLKRDINEVIDILGLPKSRKQSIY